MVSSMNSYSPNPCSHVELGMLAHIISISLGLADIAHGRIVILLFETVVDTVLVLLDALGFLHAGQQRECGFGTGLGL